VTSGRYLTIITNAVSTASFGNITINSASPFDSPVINPNFLGEYYDVATLREGVKAAQRLTQSKAFTDHFIVEPIESLVKAVAGGDESIEAAAREESTTTWQPMGSTPMTKAGGTGGVLDPTLKVLGTVGLRVVDAGAFVSFYPFLFSLQSVLMHNHSRSVLLQAVSTLSTSSQSAPRILSRRMPHNNPARRILPSLFSPHLNTHLHSFRLFRLLLNSGSSCVGQLHHC